MLNRSSIFLRIPSFLLPLLINACLCYGLVSGVSAVADDVDSWVGARVMARNSGTKLKVGSVVSATLNAGSVFRVDRAQGDWLWVDSGNIRGWVKKTDVVAFDQALAFFTEVITQGGADAYAYVSRGIVQHTHRDHDKAIADYTEAIKLDRNDPWPFHDRAVAYYAKQNYPRALDDAAEAVRLDPSEATHRANRASVYFALKDYDKAIEEYNDALQHLKGDEATLDDSSEEGQPGQTQGRLSTAKWTCARAECWAAKHAQDKAIADYTEASRLDPKDAATINSLAWLLATCEDPRFRDGMKAFTLAARACELTGYRNHLCLDTLAATYAEAGDFAAAIRWQVAALDLAANDVNVAPGYRARLKLFSERHAYHEPSAH